MKNTLFLSMLAAALMGGYVFAESVVYKVSELGDGAAINIEGDHIDATIVVDAQKPIWLIDTTEASSLTLDYQDNYVLTSDRMDTPVFGVLNITSTVPSVAIAWESAFSVGDGGSITLCHADSHLGVAYDTLQFFGTAADNTVKLGNTEVLFKGEVASKDALAMNQVGIVWGEQDMLLVGKVQKSVPEPTTGSLSLLALAGLCARRRRK